MKKINEELDTSNAMIKDIESVHDEEEN